MTCTFIPPYLLRRIAAAGHGQSLLAPGRGTLRVDDDLRAKRASLIPAERLPAVDVEARRLVHDAGNAELLPGTPVRGDDDPPTGDVAVDEAFDSSGQIWALFAEQFGRESVDAADSTVLITVHYGRNYDNAFWDGTQLVFGDGDGTIFDRFTKPMDVMAHEFTHGVIQFSAGLIYAGQPGALNESVSDVFAAMVKQRQLEQPADAADWLIGEGLFLPGVQARALRSMLEPGTAYDDPRLGRDPQVGSMADYVQTEDDNGGVHINSGIPNRAFARAAIMLGGFSWERAGAVWYDALTSGQVGPRTDFRGFAEATVAAAERRFSADPAVVEAVRAGWTEVGVLGSDAAAPFQPGQPPVTAQTIAVRRSGGFAGGVKRGELDLTSEPDGTEVRRLLRQVNLAQASFSRTQPDRFIYTVQCGDWRVTLPEQDLTPELHRVVQLVLGQDSSFRGDL